MEQNPDRIFLDYSIQKLRQLSSRIEDCLGRLTDEQVWMRGSENENAVGNLVLHLSGNVRQWVISAVGGQPDIREREKEFSSRGEVPISEMLERLRGTLDEAVIVLERVKPEQLTQRISVQKYNISILVAVYHVVEHFAQHTGQIIFATKLLTGKDLGYYKHLRLPGAHGRKTP